MRYEMLVVAGRRGRGKSAYAVREILLTLKKGRNVWANFPLDFRTQKNIPKKCFFADSLEDIADMRDGLFVVDEAHYLASGRWKTLTKDTHALISLSRHLRMRIIFISQNFRRLDPIIRELADGVLIFRSKIGRLSRGKYWYPDELSEEGKPKEKARSYGAEWLWHTTRLHACYDDEDLTLDLLKKRKPRTWKPNGFGYDSERSSLPPSADKG